MEEFELSRFGVETWSVSDVSFFSAYFEWENENASLDMKCPSSNVLFHSSIED